MSERNPYRWARRLLPLAAVSLLASACSPQSQTPSAAQGGADWVATWHSGVVDAAASTGNITYRLLIHGAIGGQTVRLRFSNRYGKEALVLRSVRIALPLSVLNSTPAKLAPVDAATVTPVTFAGADEVSIPAGQEASSDAVAFALPDYSDAAVTFYVPGAVSNITAKSNSLTSSWSNGADGGDDSADVSGTSLLHLEGFWPFLTGLDVVAPGVTTVVALGDSITDGAFEVPNGDTRWPDLLNRRIAASDLAGRRSVVNAGISGNMVTGDRDGNATSGQAAITRMAWDVFALPNVSHVILYEGINDITVGVTGEQVIAGLRTVIDEAHRRGIKVIVSTLTPCVGAVDALGCSESQRLLINDWVRGDNPADASIDFDAAVGTGLRPETWLPYLTVDYLHPNPLGLVVMADSFPLETLR